MLYKVIAAALLVSSTDAYTVTAGIRTRMRTHEHLCTSYNLMQKLYHGRMHIDKMHTVCPDT